MSKIFTVFFFCFFTERVFAETTTLDVVQNTAELQNYRSSRKQKPTEKPPQISNRQLSRYFTTTFLQHRTTRKNSTAGDMRKHSTTRRATRQKWRTHSEHVSERGQRGTNIKQIRQAILDQRRRGQEGHVLDGSSPSGRSRQRERFRHSLSQAL